MNYSKLAKETWDLYRAFRNETFGTEQAFELTKLCMLSPYFNTGIFERPNHIAKGADVAGVINFKDGCELAVRDFVRFKDISVIMETDCGKYRSEYAENNRSYYRLDEGTGEWKAADDIAYICLFR